MNYFPTSPGPDGRGKVTLLTTVGSKLMLDGSALLPIRFLKKINGILYAVIGNTFCRVNINVLAQTATLTNIGNLNSSSGTVIGTNNPTQIILLDGTDGYIYNSTFAGTVPLGQIGGTAGDTYTLTINGVSIYSGFSVATALDPLVLISTINTHTATTQVTATYINGLLTLTGNTGITSITVSESGTGFNAGVDGISVNPGVFSSPLPFSQFQQITDVDFAGGSHVVYIDGYFIVNTASSQRFQFSQPNEGRVWIGLDIASAESKPDTIVALGETKGELWVFGTNSIEVWFDNNNPVGSPFSKRIGSDIDVGCQAPYSVTSVNDLLVWVDSRGFIVQSDISPIFRDQSTGYTLKKISDEALDAELATYTNLRDVIGTTYQYRGHIMAEFTFPTDKKTWVYDFNTEKWHERGITEPELGRMEHTLNQYCDTYQNLLISGGIRDGSLYLMSSEYFYDDDQLISRSFSTAHFDNEGNQIGVDGLELKIKSGETITPDYEVEYDVILKFSNDGAYTWSNPIPRSMGTTGEYFKRLNWNMLGSSHQWNLHFTTAAPIDHSIIDLSANINLEVD